MAMSRYDSVRKSYKANDKDDDSKVKTKLKSMWNNIKYGWTLRMKTNFSKFSPIWLLGTHYYKKYDEQGQPIPIDDDVIIDEETGIQGFIKDFTTRIWLTYRREFPILTGSNYTSDCGWGCMLRSGQMLLAQALLCHFLGRDWRWDPLCTYTSTDTLHKEDVIHRKIIRWFGDNALDVSPLSIHSLVAVGEALGKKAGDWYGPASVAHILKQAVENATTVNKEFEQFKVYVSIDCAVYKKDVMKLCNTDDGWKSLILLVPVRLGTEKLNSIYGECLKNLLTLPNCIGIIGGRPRHSLYFVGFQDDKFIHLDPHYCQENVDVWQGNFPLLSFHCKGPRKLSILKMDPSCCLGFYFKTKFEFQSFVDNVPQYLVPSGGKCEFPMFVFSDGGSEDSIFIPKYIIPDDSLERTDFDDTLESEEFEII